MRSVLPAPILGALTLVLFVINLIFWNIPFYVVAILKLIIPIPAWRQLCGRWLVMLATWWIDGNKVIEALHGLDWDIEGVDDLPRDEWYLVSSNHQSWVDIFVLQYVFNHRIPFLKFFIKQQLIWIPLLGLAWWALDMPFMHRHSKEKIARNPELRGQDLEATRRACEHFKDSPTSIINFLEGTRFTPEKHARQGSPFRYLLKPKTGGIAFVLSAMGDMLNSLLSVTIVYPAPGMTFWDLLCGRMPRIVVRVEREPIPQDLLDGDYLNDSDFRERLRTWVMASWESKDALIAELTENDAAQRDD